MSDKFADLLALDAALDRIGARDDFVAFAASESAFGDGDLLAGLAGFAATLDERPIPLTPMPVRVETLASTRGLTPLRKAGWALTTTVTMMITSTGVAAAAGDGPLAPLHFVTNQVLHLGPHRGAKLPGWDVNGSGQISSVYGLGTPGGRLGGIGIDDGTGPGSKPHHPHAGGGSTPAQPGGSGGGTNPDGSGPSTGSHGGGGGGGTHRPGFQRVPGSGQHCGHSGHSGGGSGGGPPTTPVPASGGGSAPGQGGTPPAQRECTTHHHPGQIHHGGSGSGGLGRSSGAGGGTGTGSRPGAGTGTGTPGGTGPGAGSGAGTGTGTGHAGGQDHTGT